MIIRLCKRHKMRHCISCLSMLHREAQTSSPLDVTGRSDTVTPNGSQVTRLPNKMEVKVDFQNNTKNAGFAPIEALLIILVILTIALGCTPCQKEVANDLLQKLNTSLNGDKNKSNTAKQKEASHGSTQKDDKKIIQKKLPQREQSFKKECNLNTTRRVSPLMPCYEPIQAWHSKTLNESINGNVQKRSLVFSPKLAHQADDPLEIACGQCIGCRLERSRQWAIRCTDEANQYENNCFITLTFSDEGLIKREKEYIATNIKRSKNNKDLIDVPSRESIHTRDFQLFMKKLRKKYGEKIRFFQCGEYGEKCETCQLHRRHCQCQIYKPTIGRPHYHALLFNFDFPDRKLHQEITTKNTEDYKLYSSKSLDALWGMGKTIIGNVTFESSAYVARYIMKKRTGSQAEKHYQKIIDGEIIQLKPEYITMSRRPGIGKKWFDKYYQDLYPSDFITVNGKKCKVPKYYDTLYSELEPHLYDLIKQERLDNVDPSHPDKTVSRMETRQKLHILKAKTLQRNNYKES